MGVGETGDERQGESGGMVFGTSRQLSTDAEVFGHLRAEADAGTGKRLAWIEYGAEPGCDLDDRDQWGAANPGRIGVEAIEAERRELSEAGFARERLNLWHADRAEVVIDPEVWAALQASGPADDAPPSAIAVDASPDRAMAIAGAWRVRERTHVELLGVDRCDPLDALQFVTERAGRRIPVVIDGASPAAALVPALTAARVKVVLTTARDMARACGAFTDDVAAGRVSHAGQPALDAAVAGARRRPIGDAGAWGWDRRPDGAVFLAPLVAVTLARHGAVTAGRPRSNRAVFV